ncbi:hypothetical protein TKK_0017630 [Trichogramma kaykai]
MVSVPTEEEVADEITRTILVVARFQGKAKEAKEVKFPLTADFHSGSYEVKLERVEQLIHGLSNYLKIRGNIHYQVCPPYGLLGACHRGTQRNVGAPRNAFYFLQPRDGP